MSATVGLLLCLVSFYIGRWTGRDDVYREMLELIGSKYADKS